MNVPVRLVIADDHPVFRFGLHTALAGALEIQVVGEASDGAELVRLVEELRPVVVLCDLAMPGVDGVSAIRLLREKHPQIGVLVLTMHAESEAVFGALRAGARGYLLKGAERDEIVRAVLTVAAGGTVYDRDIGQRVTDYLTGTAPMGGKLFPELTDREHEVFEHLATGAGNHEIANALHLSEKTVRNHVATILAKLHQRDRAAAVATARDRGLGIGSREGRG